eukprot:2792237-Pyramimonas_sp.AAC.1
MNQPLDPPPSSDSAMPLLFRPFALTGNCPVCASLTPGPPLLRLVLTLGLCCLPSCDWFSRW